MVVATDQFDRLAHRGQEAFSAAIRVWEDTLRSYPRVAPSSEALAVAYSTVDAAFDLAERVLANQREFTKTLISVGTETITNQATWFATHTAEAAKDAGHEEAEAPARPADNAAQSADQTEPASVTPVTPDAAPKRPRTPRKTGDA
jgi:hypothetical protein